MTVKSAPAPFAMKNERSAYSQAVGEALGEGEGAVVGVPVGAAVGATVGASVSPSIRHCPPWQVPGNSVSTPLTTKDNSVPLALLPLAAMANTRSGRASPVRSRRCMARRGPKASAVANVAPSNPWPQLVGLLTTQSTVSPASSTDTTSSATLSPSRSLLSA